MVDLVRYSWLKMPGSSTLLPCARPDGEWVKHSEAATLIETQAVRISLLERGIEQAFRDGISYATNVDVKDVELAWNTSRARALNGGE